MTSQQNPDAGGRPQDTYRWGETMPQYAVLGIGAEAWVELNEIEKRGERYRSNDRSSMSISWRTFHCVMSVLKAIRLEDFEQAAGDRPSLDQDLGTLLEVDAAAPAPTRVAAFLRLYAARIRNNERWDIPETMAAAYESAALELDRFMAVGARPAPQEPIDPKAVEELRVALVAGCQWLSDKSNARTLAWGVPESETEKLIHCCVGALRTGWSILCELADRALPVSSPASPQDEQRAVSKGIASLLTARLQPDEPTDADLMNPEVSSPASASPDLVAYLTTSSPKRRDAAFLRTFAARCRDSKQVVLLWEIPHTVASTLEDIAARLEADCDVAAPVLPEPPHAEPVERQVMSSAADNAQSVSAHSLRAEAGVTHPAENTSASSSLAAILGTLPERNHVYGHTCYFKEDVAQIVSALQHEIAQLKRRI